MKVTVKESSLTSERGAAAVEFALLLPVLSLVLYGIMVFGIFFHAYLGISHATNEGARWAALRASETEVATKVKQSSPQIEWDRAVITLTGVPSTGATDSEQGDPVTVKITYELPESYMSLRQAINNLAGLFGGGALLPAQISMHATQRVE